MIFDFTSLFYWVCIWKLTFSFFKHRNKLRIISKRHTVMKLFFMNSKLLKATFRCAIRKNLKVQKLSTYAFDFFQRSFRYCLGFLMQSFDTSLRDILKNYQQIKNLWSCVCCSYDMKVHFEYDLYDDINDV